eukprot:TRINITY_DN5702_c0_g1_i1.p1 TRINITY_DN5702_c0_g1~~TRINITY_DN5702_c0_g1_i1.p1  ORF type:complete len:600 (+),score=73.78 TRINITY_DN5702_c0_g1_i1:3-1802(+)
MSVVQPLTFAHEEAMPRLPVPELEETLNKWKKTVSALATPEEMRELDVLVEQFLNGEGPDLQKKLMTKRQAAQFSWLEDWWFNYAYYDFREPVLINVSYQMRLADHPSPSISQLARAASLCSGLLWLKGLVERETLPVERNKDSPLCMAAVRYIFHTCRMPHPTRDYPEYFSPTESSNIIVIKNGQFYSFEAYNAVGTPLTPSEIEQVLSEIVELEAKSKPYAPVGVLTSDHRSTWFETRSLLALDQTNKESLAQIQRAAFVLCLDACSPRGDDEMAHTLLVGDSQYHNRFYDKPLQLVVFENGRAGIVGEHSRLDGQPVGVALGLVIDREQEFSRLSELTPPELKSTSSVAPMRLSWNLSATTLRDIDNSSRQALGAIANLQFSDDHFSHFGKRAIKAAKFSPDALMQIAIQLSYFRLHHAHVAQYESTSTRTFARGRTEVTRSCTPEVVQFVKAFMTENASPAKLLQLLQKAGSAHRSYGMAASKGFGVDRHILGLQLLANENRQAPPALFTHPAAARSSRWILSTSQIGLSHVESIAFGPVVSNGYGICYLIKQDYINICVTSFEDCAETNAKRFTATLNESILSLYSLLLSHSKL